MTRWNIKCVFCAQLYIGYSLVASFYTYSTGVQQVWQDASKLNLKTLANEFSSKLRTVEKVNGTQLR